MTTVLDACSMDKEIYCVFCKETVYLKEQEFNNHMKLTHGIFSHLDILLAINFINQLDKARIVSRIREKVKQTQNKQYFPCLFCNTNGKEKTFKLANLIEFRIHLQETHSMFYELDLVFAMQLINNPRNIKQNLFVLDVHANKFINNSAFNKSKVSVQKQLLAGGDDSKSINHTQILAKQVAFDYHEIPYIGKTEEQKHQVNKIKDNRVPCMICNKSFKQKNSLKNHLKTHSGELPFKCKLCDKGFAQKGNMKSHIEKSHAINKKRSSCFMCSRSFKSETSLQIHMQKHKGELSFICPFCSYGFTQKGNMKSHIQKLHAKTPTENKEALDFPEMVKYEAVIPCKNNLASDDVDSSFDNPLIDSKIFPQLNNIFIYNIVSDIIDKILNKIIRKYSEVQDIMTTFNCPCCKKLLMSHAALVKHTRSRHLSKKLNQCPKCEKVFKYPNGLERHIDTHNDEKAYQCSECTEDFYTLDKLGKHKKIHATYFTCHWCPETSFPGSAALKAHKLLHNNETKRRHMCKECSKTFESPGDLRRHSKAHSTERPFTCTHCKKSYKWYDQLDQHFQTHNLERPWSCKQCPKTFKTAGNLRGHSRRHSTGKPHICVKCNKSLKNQQTLGRHICKIIGPLLYC